MKKLLLMVCVVLLCACNKQNLYQYHALVFTNETSSYRVSIMEGDLQKKIILAFTAPPGKKLI